MYVDNVLSIREDADGLINILEHFFLLKEWSFGRPDGYLGANIDRIQTNDG